MKILLNVVFIDDVWEIENFTSDPIKFLWLGHSVARSSDIFFQKNHMDTSLIGRWIDLKNIR